MKSIFAISLLAFSFSACTKYNEEQGCFEKPSYKVCDAQDGLSTPLNLEVNLLGNYSFPVKIKIYNRSVAGGLEGLHTTFTQYSNFATYQLPDGRYTAELIFPDQTTTLMDFRVYVEHDIYCSGDCYEMHNAKLDVQKPLQ